ncbi:MAG: TonB-dependent receptor [Vicinamibacterales bacterium]
MTRDTLARSFLILSLLSSPPAHAQGTAQAGAQGGGPPITIVADRVVVTASRTPLMRTHVIESVSVVDADDIAAIGASSLADVLRVVPGLSVESTGREGALTSLFSRGGESDYTLVLIDGVRVNQSGGRFDYSRIAAGEIDRIEIVRGAQSALYGSDAIGGVVQIFTRRGAASGAPSGVPQFAGALEGGGFNTWRGDLRVSGGARDRMDYQAGVTYRSSDGAFGDLLPERDRFDQMTFDGGIGVDAGRGVTLRTGIRYSDAEGRAVGPIGFGAGDRGTAYDSKDLSWHVDAAQQVKGAFSHSAQVAWFRSENMSADTVADPSYTLFAVLEGTPGARFPAGPRLVRLIQKPEYDAALAGSLALGANQFVATTPFGVGDFPFSSATELRRPAVKYQADVTWAANQVLSAGYEYERERNPLSDGFVIDNHAYFAQQRFSMGDRWFATIGARADDNSRYGGSVSPKLSAGGYVVPFNTGALSSAKLFVNVGKGIKNPVFDELFGSAFVDGNPDLRPERARTIDVGAEVTLAAQRYAARVVYFDNHYRDQVAYKGTSFSVDGLPDYLNIEGAETRGLELEFGLQRPVAGLTASAGYTLLNSEVTSTVSTNAEFQLGQPLLRRPKHSGNLRITYEAGSIGVTLTGRFVGERHDAAFLGLSAPMQRGITAAQGVDITVNPGYQAFTLNGEYRVRPAFTVFARVDNLTDEAYESALGYPGLPRAAVVGARFSLGRK